MALVTDTPGAGRPDTPDDHRPGGSAPPPPTASDHTRLAGGAVLAAGAPLAVIVGADGSTAGRIGRAAGALVLLVAVAAGERRLTGRLRGLLLVAVGLLASAVGLGIGPRQLAAGGRALVAGAGLVALAAGIVLVVIGTRALVRGARLPVRIGTIAAVVVATWIVWWSLGQAVAATNVPADAGPPARTPAALGLAAEDARFPAGDGVTLAGWWIASRNGAAVVVVPGAGSTRADALDQAAVLARNGYGVLVVDPRGHGASAGRAMDFGWYGDDDVAGAVAFARTRPGVDPDRVGALGLSMGGEEVVGAAAAVPGLRAVVAEGATARVAADWDWLADAFGARGAAQEQLQRLTYGLTDLLTDASPPVPLREAVAAAAPRPVLLIAAGTKPDERRAMNHIAGAAPASVTTWVVDGAGHTGGLAARPDEWEQRVTAFLDTALAPR